MAELIGYFSISLKKLPDGNYILVEHLLTFDTAGMTFRKNIILTKLRPKLYKIK